jgi:predicted nucleotidyltransferase
MSLGGCYRMSSSGWVSRGPNFADEYRELARQLARRYAVMEGVVGVVLTGGLTFGEADRYSDVDLIVYLYEQSLRTWYFGEAPLPEGESIYRGLRLDLSYRDFRAEQGREWTPRDLWSVSRAEILYDPEGLVAELLEGKLRITDEAFELQALERAAYIRRLLDRIVPGWLYRGEVPAAHHVLNRSADQLIGLVHLINRQYIPGDDWNVALSEELAWAPADFRARIEQALVAEALSSAEASRRRYILSSILLECWNHLTGDEPIEDRSSAVLQRRMLREMVVEGEMPLERFLARFDRRMLIQSPAYDLLQIERSDEGARVIFNHQRLRHLIHHELGRFLDYQRRLLRELAAAGGTEIDS